MWSILSSLLCCTIGQTRRPVTIINFEDTKDVETLFDSGSELSLISYALFKKLPASRSPLKRLGANLVGANGGQLRVMGETSLSFSVGPRTYRRPFAVIEGLQIPAIIGMDTMAAENISIDPMNKKIRLGKVYGNSSHLTASKSYVIQNEEETTIKLKVPKEQRGRSNKGCLMVKSIGSKVDVVDALYDADSEQVEVKVVNTGHTPLDINRGEIIASVEWVDLERVQAINSVLRKTPIKTQQIPSSIINDKLTRIPPSRHQQFGSILQNYSDVFSVDPNDVGKCSIIKQDIKLIDETNVSSQPPYRTPRHLLPVAHSYVQKLLQNNIIRPSKSPFSSPLLLVKKPGAHDPTKSLDESYRVVHDYRRLNNNTIKDAYPMQHLQELIDEVGQGKIYTLVDLSQGFWSQELTEQSKPKTAFGVPGLGHFEYNRSAQGLCNSPSAFQRLLDYVTRGLKGTRVYLDDIIIISQNFDEHATQLSALFEKFREHGLKCRLGKLQLAVDEVNYLGYNISQKHGIRPGELKTKAISRWTPPTDVKQIKQFLGLCSFFRRTIPKFSQLAKPLTLLTRKDATWTKGQLPPLALKAFYDIRQRLSTRPCLKPVDFNKEFIITVDTSMTGIGAILSQQHQNVEYPCAYASRTLSDAESRYPPTRLEALGILWACRHFRPYLIGKHFTIRTDHKPLLALNRLHGQALDRIYAEMEEFLPYTIKYLEGSKMPADALSRLFSVSSEPLLSVSQPQLISMQRTDKYIKALVCKLRFGIIPSFSSDLRAFVAHWQDKVMIQNGLVGITRNNLFLVFAPFQLRATLLSLAHDAQLAGHWGTEKTLERLQTDWYWPNMRQEVTNYCRSCHQCLATNPSSNQRPMPLEPLTPVSRFNQRVHIDLMGPFAKSRQGSTYVVAMSDAFSSYVEFAAIPDKQAETVANAFFNTWITRHSICERVNSDLGSEFQAEIFEYLCSKLGIKHFFSSAAHPMSNGQIERVNRSFLSYVRKFIEQNEDWESFLPMLKFAMNTAPHSTKQYTPHFIVYGRRPTLATSLLNPTHSYSEEVLKQRLAAMSRIAADVYQLQNDAFHRQKMQFDRRTKIRTVNIGDLVYMTQSPQGPLMQKFQKRYDGPYTVIDIKGHNNVLLQHCHLPKITSVHLNRLKWAPFRQQMHQSQTSLEKPRSRRKKLNTLYDRTMKALRCTNPKTSMSDDNENTDTANNDGDGNNLQPVVEAQPDLERLLPEQINRAPIQQPPPGRPLTRRQAAEQNINLPDARDVPFPTLK